MIEEEKALWFEITKLLVGTIYFQSNLLILRNKFNKKEKRTK